MDRNDALYLDWAATASTLPGAALPIESDAKMLTFELAGWWFAIPGTQAQAVVRAGEIERVHELPGMEPPLEGMANHMGYALPVYDIAAAWRKGAPSKPCLLVMGRPDKQIGLWLSGLPRSSRLARSYAPAELSSLGLPETIERASIRAWRKTDPLLTNSPEWIFEMPPIDDFTARFDID